MDELKPLAPPYVSYHSFEVLLARAWTTGPPAEFDRDGLAPVPEQAHKHLRAALRFLQLMDENLRPTPLFGRLAGATTTKARREILEEVVRGAYEAVMWLPLGSVSRDSLQMEVEKQYQTTRETTRKSAAFFIQIARAAGFELGHELVRRMGAAPSLGGSEVEDSSASSSPDGEAQQDTLQNEVLPAVPKETEGEMVPAAPSPQANGSAGTAHGRYQVLLDIVDLERMEGEQLKAALVLMKYVRESEKAGK